MDLDSKMKVDNIIDDAFKQANFLLDNYKETPNARIFQTIRVRQNNVQSYYDAYMHYWCGLFEGLLMTLYLNEIDEWPTNEQIEFMRDSYFDSKKWEDYVNKISNVIRIEWEKDSKDKEKSHS